mgnify:CR=1 FL=1|tara:strand:- start:852 stop:2306 length:1455 start_codon:yes stop_codon:yes gene_type:complete
MINTLLHETFLYGNLELAYTRKKIKTINLDNFIEILTENKEEDLGYMWPWRFYKNYKYLYSIYENNIITQKETGVIFITLLEKIITFASKLNYNISDININNFKHDKIIFLIMLRELQDRLKNITIFNENNNIKYLKEIFDQKFAYILTDYKDLLIMHDYILPYEKNQWSPSWCVTFEDKTEIIPNIDIFTDYYFLFHNIRFNHYMKKDISMLNKRLNFIEKKAPEYFEKFIVEKLTPLSKNIFFSYPYKLIYENYLDLAKNYKQIYIPDVLKYLELDKINGDIWLLSILPKYLTAYLLGFPIISSDVPNEKNISKIIEKILSSDINEYWQEIYHNNSQIIKLKSMNVECGNNKEGEKIIDLTYTPVEEYNSDDTFLLFNEGVYCVFAYPEFEDLVANERNPYNRNTIPVFASILSAIKFKKKVRRQLNGRYLDINLNTTMEDNFKMIKENLYKDNDYDNVIDNYHNFTNSLINMFLANNFYSN